MLASVEPLPSSFTVASEATVWSVPAFATGATFGCLTWITTVSVAHEVF